jgi:hypothetical protein
MEASGSCYTLVHIYQIVFLKAVILINTSGMKIAGHICMLFRYFFFRIFYILCSRVNRFSCDLCWFSLNLPFTFNIMGLGSTLQTSMYCTVSLDNLLYTALGCVLRRKGINLTFSWHLTFMNTAVLKNFIALVHIVVCYATEDANQISKWVLLQFHMSWLQSLITLLHIYTAYKPYTPIFPCVR